jgi:hypothetical protein
MGQCVWKWLDKDRGRDVVESKLETWIIACSLESTIRNNINIYTEINSQHPLEAYPMQTPAGNVPVKEQ